MNTLLYKLYGISSVTLFAANRMRTETISFIATIFIFPSFMDDIQETDDQRFNQNILQTQPAYLNSFNNVCKILKFPIKE